MEPNKLNRSKSDIKLTKKQCVGNEIERVAKIEINDNNLVLGMNQGSKEVKISKIICDCKFIFDESMLTGIKFGAKRAHVNFQIFWKRC